jgi:hypothetical protein
MPDSFHGYGNCSCNLLFETDNVGADQIFLPCLVSKIQKPPLLGLEIRIFFGFLTFQYLFLITENKQMKFDSNQ